MGLDLLCRATAFASHPAAFGISVGGFLGGLVGSLFPLLAVLACPLGMYFLMRGMQRPMGEQQAQQGTQPQPASPPEPEVIEVTEYQMKPVTADGRNAQRSEGRSIAEAVEPVSDSVPVSKSSRDAA